MQEGPTLGLSEFAFLNTSAKCSVQLGSKLFIVGNTFVAEDVFLDRLTAVQEISVAAT